MHIPAAAIDAIGMNPENFNKKINEKFEFK